MRKTKTLLYSILLLSLSFVLCSCSLTSTPTTDTEVVDTVPKEDYLDTTIAKNLFLQIFDSSIYRTNVRSVTTIKSIEYGYLDNGKIYATESEEIETFSKVETEHEIVISMDRKYTLTNNELIETFPVHYWFFKQNGICYSATRYVTTNNIERFYSIIDYDEWEALFREYTALSFIFDDFDMHPFVQSRNITFIGKKITVGNAINYEFRALLDTADERVNIVCFVENNLITSVEFEHFCYEDFSIKGTSTITYNYTSVSLPNLESYEFMGDW